MRYVRCPYNEVYLQMLSLCPFEYTAVMTDWKVMHEKEVNHTNLVAVVCLSLIIIQLSSQLLKQGYLMVRIKSSFMKFYGGYGDLIHFITASLQLFKLLCLV